jgi:two-component system, cell cycle sensor histidine kinase and response regulator CckA
VFSAAHYGKSGSIVILLAEDEPVVRDFVEMALTYAGYQVLAATDGDHALQVSRSYMGTIDLLLSDVRMPNMIGTDLATAIEKERPGIRVMFMTGEGSGEIPPPLKLTLLRKPFLPKQLLEGVARVLSTGHTSRLL